MDSLLAGISQHGYSILFLVVFLEAVGVPVPAAVALLLAGGASARGPLRLDIALASAIAAMVLGDTLMYMLGRFSGWWLLGMLCRLSLNPESCILRSADSFYRRGRTVMLFAKFVPGLNTMAPPLAGSMHMRWSQFLFLDFAGTAIYVGAYSLAGFIFSDIVGHITAGVKTFGHVVSWLVAAAVLVYAGHQIRLWFKARVLRTVPRVPAAEVARRLYDSAEDIVVYDVRSHGYYERDARRIQGSARLEPNALHQVTGNMPKQKQVFVYCTCLKQATSARVAHELRKQGIQVSVIDGGLRKWREAGLPLEPVPEDDIVALPSFGG